MKKKWIVAFAVLVLMAGIAVCQEKESSKGLIIEGAKVTGYTFEVPEKLFIPKGVAEIDEDAFENCLTLVSVTIPDTVVRIGECAFYGCENLKSVTIGKGGKSIGEGAFYGCESLVSVAIPKNVTSIGEDLFYDCTSLKEIQFGGTMAQWKAIQGSDGVNVSCVLCSDGYIGVKDVPVYLEMYGTVVEGFNDKVPANLVIPEGVTKIGNGAFEHCASLASVAIPEGVTEIGNYAFRGCASLMSVTIPKSVTEVGSGAFEGCKGIEVIYEGALKDWCATDWDYSICENAKIITLSDGKDLKKLTKIDAGDLAGVTKIGDYAFSKCTSLVSVTIHGSVTKIGAFAFGGCTSLASVTIPSSVTKVDDGAFQNCTSLVSVIIPRSVTKIGAGAFCGCTLLASVIIPKSVTEIKLDAFGNSPNLNIQYDGTKAQWKAISKGNCVSKTTGIIVWCTDGNLHGR